jgi:hypothetical protein
MDDGETLGNDYREGALGSLTEATLAANAGRQLAAGLEHVSPAFIGNPDAALARARIIQGKSPLDTQQILRMRRMGRDRP